MSYYSCLKRDACLFSTSILNKADDTPETCANKEQAMLSIGTENGKENQGQKTTGRIEPKKM